MSNYSWTKTAGPDVYFGGGAEQFLPGPGSYQGKDYYAEFAKKGYTVSWNKTSLLSAPTGQKALGIFCRSNLPVWLDRNIFPENLDKLDNHPSGAAEPATDLPGLKDMTLKAIDVLHERGGSKGFFLMSEAASVDKQMHALDYDRALGDLLELDDTIRATVRKLDQMGLLDETLIVVSADHGHGFGEFFFFFFSFFCALVPFTPLFIVNQSKSTIGNSKTNSPSRPYTQTSLAAPTPSTWRRTRTATTARSATPSACTSAPGCRGTRSRRRA